MAILTEIKDPRVQNVTVTFVEVTPDMRQAKVHVSVMGDETKQQLSLRGLQNSAGFLQSKVAKRIDTRYTPRLAFVLDLGVKRSLEISQILQSVLPPSPAVSESTSTEEPLSDEEADADWEDDDEAEGDDSEDGSSDDDDDREDDNADAEDAEDENTADGKEAS